MNEQRAQKDLKKFFVGLITGLVAGAVLLSGITAIINEKLAKDREKTKAYGTLIGDAVLGQAKETADLVVFEQEIMRVRQISKEGLGKLKIFSKSQYINYAGTGLFSVDLSRMSSQYITVSDSAKSVTVVIPKAELKTVTLDYDRIQYSDTINGMLSFGSLKLTIEESNAFNAEMEKIMREDLTDPASKAIKNANEIARLKCYQIFSPVIEAVASDYRLTVLTEKM